MAKPTKRNQLIKDALKDDQWVQKFVRESVFMPFGSLLNAYGQVYRGKDIPFKEFKEQVKELFTVSLCFIDVALVNSTPIPDIPDMTREERMKLGAEWQKKYNEMSENTITEEEQKKIDEMIEGKIDDDIIAKKVAEEQLPIIEAE
jgi:hypothetical protein